MYEHTFYEGNNDWYKFILMEINRRMNDEK